MGASWIDVTKVRFDHRVEESVLSVLRSGMIAQGPVVEAMEHAVAAVAGVRHAVAVNNGTAALIAALHALDVGVGDEVITSPFTFVATLNAILALGARPRFADIDVDTFTICPANIEALVTSRTKAVLPVHLYGQPANMTALTAIAQRHGLAIVEDAAQALGATHAGRAVGSFGLGAFSFYATKNVTTGEGGVVTTNEDDLAERLRAFRNQGMRERYRYDAFGLNFRLTDLQAAVGLPQLNRLEEINETRARHAAVLTAGLDDLRGLHVPSVRHGDRHVFHHYTVRIDARARLDRDALKVCLADARIGAAVYYPRLVCDRLADICPAAAAVTGQVLSLPVHQHLSEGDLHRIICAVRAALA